MAEVLSPEEIEKYIRKAEEAIAGITAPTPPPAPTPTPPPPKVETKVETTPAGEAKPKPKAKREITVAEASKALEELCKAVGGTYIPAGKPACLILNVGGFYVDNVTREFGITRYEVTYEAGKRKITEDTKAFVLPEKVNITVAPGGAVKTRMPSLTFEVGTKESNIIFKTRGIRTPEDLKKMPDMFCYAEERPAKMIKCYLIPAPKVGRKYEETKPEDYSYDEKTRRWRFRGKALRKY